MRIRLLAYLFLGALLAGCTQPDPPTIPFYPALQSGDLDQIERHIVHGADLEAMGSDGRRPLHVAAESGRWVVAEMLLKYGADINATDSSGRTPLFVALASGNSRIADMFLKKGASLDADALLREATVAGISDRDVMNFLVKHGADVNKTYADGKTPLILAVENSHRLVTKSLIGRGADVNLQDGAGRLPLQVAEDLGNQDIIRLLLRNGALNETQN